MTPSEYLIESINKFINYKIRKYKEPANACLIDLAIMQELGNMVSAMDYIQDEFDCNQNCIKGVQKELNFGTMLYAIIKSYANLPCGEEYVSELINKLQQHIANVLSAQ